MKNKYLTILLIVFVFATVYISCTTKDSKAIEVSYIQEGQLVTTNIPFEIINGKEKLESEYVDNVRFSSLDSIIFENNHPDKEQLFTTPIKLDFEKKIEKHSPEYYSIYIIHSINRAMNYYNKLFNNRIDFNSQKDYKDIQITFGDVPLITTPKNFILERNSNPSPSIFYHEIGHRAFWLLQDSLNVKFEGLSYIHMGLLEYFTVSLTDSPIVGEDIFPPLLIRDASALYPYPADSTLTLTGLFKLIKVSYAEKIEDPATNINRFYKAYEDTYSSYFNTILDNHRAGMIITSTLWRIRTQLGQEVMDNLVAKTILHLNASIDKRPEFYVPYKEEKLFDKVEWYDLFYALITMNREINNAIGEDIIIKEFTTTGFPLHQVNIKDLN